MLYSATGNAWINPEVITISFMPDGTNMGGPVSNLQGKFNSNANLAGKWEQQFLQAAQTWAEQTNINFVVVPDDGTAMGGGADQEGAPDFGDIRIGGYNFGSSTLAWSYQPPSVNNFSLAGDIEINTGMTWNIGQTYDLFTVAAHEFGHALGLGEGTVSGSMMYPTYQGKKAALAADDIAGIQSIYDGPRQSDAYLGLNSTMPTAANLDGQINPSTLTGLAYNLDIAGPGQAEFFSVDAPAGTNGTMNLTVQSLGLSLLAPKVTVYASDMLTVVGSAAGQDTNDGSMLNVSIPNAVAGQRYYIEVQGADNTAFGTGDYALGLGFNGTTPPTESSPIIAYANGTPLHSGGGAAQQGNANGGMIGAPPAILGISPDTGASSNDGITDANRINISGVAPGGETITMYNNGTPIGTTVANSNGNWTFNNTGTALPDGTYVFSATATDPNGNVSGLSMPYGVTIDTTPPQPPAITGISPGMEIGITLTTTSSTPTLFGTAQPYTQVTLYSGTYVVGTATANGNGDWDFAYGSISPSVGVAYGITARATDIAGNVSNSSATYLATVVYLPLFAPSATVSSASLAASSILGTNADGSFNTTATPTVSGTASSNSQVAVFEDGIIIGMASANSAGNWSFTSPALTSGRHRLTFEAVNLLGLFSAVADPITIQV